ncbi:MAG: hypothetical protein ACI9A7_001938 [Cyclobacteriaceae bacterium]|jgi:hypothetical protein
MFFFDHYTSIGVVTKPLIISLLTGRVYFLLQTFLKTDKIMVIIGIEIPQLNEEHEIEVEVRVSGIKKQYNYRLDFLLG